MIARKLCVALAVAVATVACSKGESVLRDSAMHAPAPPDTPSTAGSSARVTTGVDSVGRNPIDTSGIGRDTGRQSQAPPRTKQP
jgi:hypothetical protein